RLPAETADDATETLLGLRRERDFRTLQALELLAAGSPGGVRLAVPEHQGDGAIRLSIRLQDGNTQHFEFAQESLPEIGRVMIGGEAVRHLSVPLPALPPGYHDAVCAQDPAHVCRLIVSPATCFLNGSIAGGARSFGLTSHLYALRHGQDSGIGDFETLARFFEATARLGGSVAGINPLHHLFPTDRERASPYQPSDRRFVDPIYIDLAGLDALLHSPRLRALLAATDDTVLRLRE